MTKTDQLKIVVDIGNTLVKAAIFKSGELFSLKTFKTGNFQQLEKYLLSLESGSYCIVSNVTDYPSYLRKVFAEHLATLFFDPNTALPVKNQYKTPNTLGKDRIAAAVGAWDMFPENNLLIIDAGTTITMDFVSVSGEYLGGAISPGINMRFKALNTFTGKLPLIKKKSIKHLTGTTTEESIISGVINGIIAEIDGIIDKYKAIYPGLRVIFGGGDSNFLIKRLKNSIFAFPNITIKGLYIILTYNIENKYFI
ncbi:MAG: type III pantothenate kinase [Bacteroidales bacterium]